MEMQNYIFTINDTDKELKRRLDLKKWPVFKKTQFADDLKKGDRIVIYEAGDGKHRFIASAIVKSLSRDNFENRFVDIDEIDVWAKPLDIKKMFGELEIIRNQSHYGVYLAGGIKKLTHHDYDFIISKHTKK